MRDLQQLVAVGALQQSENMTGICNTECIGARQFEVIPSQQVFDDAENCRPFAQHDHQVEMKIVTQVANDDPHDQLAQHRRKAEPARTESTYQRDEQDAGNTEYHRRDRVAVGNVKLKRGCNRRRQQNQHQQQQASI